MITVEQLSSILYKVDPANTCCKENDATDEYDDVAKSIVQDHAFDERFPLNYFIVQNFESYFGENGYDVEKLKKAIAQLGNV